LIKLSTLKKINRLYKKNSYIYIYIYHKLVGFTLLSLKNKMANVQEGWIEQFKTFWKLKSLNEYSYQTRIAM